MNVFMSVSVISIDPSFKDGNARFTTVSLKPLSDQQCGRYCPFKVFNSDNSHLFSWSRNAHATFQ